MTGGDGTGCTARFAARLSTLPAALETCDGFDTDCSSGTATPDLADEVDDDLDAYIEEFQANYVPPEIDKEEDAGASYEWADIDDYKIRYLRMGESDSNVILIHGFGGDLDRWLFTQGPLSANASVYALDLPGHGQSTKAVRDGSVAAMADIVAKFMDAVGIDHAHLIGHSLGGAIAFGRRTNPMCASF